MNLFERCPACSRPLKWAYVAVDGGGDPEAFLPEESFHYADCKCRMGYTKHGAIEEVVADEVEVQPTLFA